LLIRCSSRAGVRRPCSLPRCARAMRGTGVSISVIGGARRTAMRGRRGRIPRSIVSRAAGELRRQSISPPDELSEELARFQRMSRESVRITQCHVDLRARRVEFAGRRVIALAAPEWQFPSAIRPSCSVHPSTNWSAGYGSRPVEEPPPSPCAGACVTRIKSRSNAAAGKSTRHCAVQTPCVADHVVDVVRPRLRWSRRTGRWGEECTMDAASPNRAIEAAEYRRGCRVLHG
jgi:hypothetical protein